MSKGLYEVKYDLMTGRLYFGYWKMECVLEAANAVYQLENGDIICRFMFDETVSYNTQGIIYCSDKTIRLFSETCPNLEKFVKDAQTYIKTQQMRDKNELMKAILKNRDEVTIQELKDRAEESSGWNECYFRMLVYLNRWKELRNGTYF